MECVDQGALSPLQAIEAIAFSPALSDPEKVQRIQDVLTAGAPDAAPSRPSCSPSRRRCWVQTMMGVYYEGLAARSRKLHNRVARLVMVLAFQGDETSALLAALRHYQAQAGHVLPTAPVDFLTPAENSTPSLTTQACCESRSIKRSSLSKPRRP